MYRRTLFGDSLQCLSSECARRFRWVRFGRFAQRSRSQGRPMVTTASAYPPALVRDDVTLRTRQRAPVGGLSASGSFMTALAGW